jgi:DNA-binding NarL/FixJ family response regulator
MITIGIVEDDKDIRTGLQKYLSHQADLLCDVVAGSVEDFLEKTRDKELPDVILSDIGLPGMSGIDGIRLLKEQNPEVDIIMVTVYNDWQKIFDSLKAGASGYLVKSTPLTEIKKAIETVHNGGSVMSPEIARKVMEFFNPAALPAEKSDDSGLTPREKQIVIGLVDGLSYKLLADRMDVSIDTIRFHIKNIYKKLHVNSKTEVKSKSMRGEI